MDFLDFSGIIDIGMDVWKQDKAEDMQQHQMNYNSAEAVKQREWQQNMRATQYQTATADMMAAGLNPMLAYHQGGAGTPSGATASAGAGNTPGLSSKFSQSLHSAAQVRNQDANTKVQLELADKTRAEADEVRARTPTHAVSIDKMRQEMAESVERIQRIIQETKTSASSAAHLDQQVKNLQATIPQIQASTQQLRTLSKLNEAQAIQQLTASGLNEAHAKEIYQRIRENLPQIERELMKLEQTARLMQQPGHQAQEAANASFVGQLGAYLRALNPLQGMIGVLPAGRATPPARDTRKDWKAR